MYSRWTLREVGIGADLYRYCDAHGLMSQAVRGNSLSTTNMRSVR
jgi:hypothetical protein